jgi:steroid delta-isomerase-like uncharacterized protein
MYEEALNNRRLEELDLVIADGYIEHAHFPGQPAGREGIKFRTGALLRAFPDIHWTVYDVIEDGNKLAVRWEFRGTHQGEFRGVSPTGRQMSMAGIDIYRVEDGRLAEHWHAVNVLGLLQQLGALPAMH